MNFKNFINFWLARAARELTQGSETSHYLEERRPIGISLVAASEKEKAQTGRTTLRFVRNV